MLNTQELIQALSMRPLTKEDMQILFSKDTLSLVDTLLKENLLVWEQVGNIAFLRPAENAPK